MTDNNQKTYKDYTRDEIKSIVAAYNLKIDVSPMRTSIFIEEPDGSIEGKGYLVSVGPGREVEEVLNEWLINYDRENV